MSPSEIHVEKMPPILLAAILSAQVFSLAMLAVVWKAWRRRLREGPFFGGAGLAAGWRPREVLLLLGGMIYVNSLGIALGAAMKKAGWLESGASQTFFFLGALGAVHLLSLLLLAWVLRARSCPWRQAFNPGGAPLARQGVSALVALGAIFIPLEVAAALSTLALEGLGIPCDIQPALRFMLEPGPVAAKGFFVFLAVLTAPLVEELYFRGILYPFLKQRMGFAGALLASSLLFGAFHFHLPSFLPLALLGAAFALLYEWSGHLGACVILHSIFNLTSLTFLLVKHAAL